MIALLLVVLAACDWDVMPDEARPATREEAAQVADVVERWEARIAPLTDDCRAYMGRLHVIEADGRAIARWCWKCPPQGDPWADCDAERYGRAAACAAHRDDTPIAVIWDGLDEPTTLYTLHHEATHLAGHCERPAGRGWLSHTDPVLWGADGVHPL
jgi:hypothetical protein